MGLEKGGRIPLDVGPQADVIAISPDGRRVFAGVAAKVGVWDGASGRDAKLALATVGFRDRHPTYRTRPVRPRQQSLSNERPHGRRML